jgi:glycosyltransferase involved in cell wall biosynthesis
VKDADLSVIVPTFNGAQFVEQALQSVFQQTLLPAEIVVVDDCSQDGTAEVVEAVAHDSPVPLRLIQLPKNSGGPAHPINIGIGSSHASLVLVLDQDDILAPDRFATDVPIIAGHQHVSVAFRWCGLLDSQRTQQTDAVKEEIVAATSRNGDFLDLDGMTGLRLLLHHKNYVFGYPAMMFRRESWVTKGGVDESLLIASDMEMFGWLLRHGHAALVPTVGYYRRFHSGNVTNRRAATNYEVARVCCALVRQEPRLRQDRETVAFVEREVTTMAYWFRQAGLYSDAAKLWQLLPSIGIGRLRVGFQICKLRLHAAIRRLLRWPLVQSHYTRI